MTARELKQQAMEEGVLGTTYVLCFDAPVGPSDAPDGHKAWHYIGWTGDELEARLTAHSNGRGSSLMAEVARLGIGWHVAQTYEGTTRHFERSLKNRGSAKRFCHRCNPDAKHRDERRAA